MIRKITACLAALALAWSQQAHAQVRITEWMYNSPGGSGVQPMEFIEFTNIGLAPVDTTGWSFDDSDPNQGKLPLTFGVIAPGESVILAEASDTDFRTAWGLPLSIKVQGLNDQNLGRNDTIQLFDSLDTLVDILAYGDQTFPGTIRTNGQSGNPLYPAALGTNDPSKWVLSSGLGDAYGSYFSIAPGAGSQANPGVYTGVPEPTTLVLGALSLVVTLGSRRRK